MENKLCPRCKTNPMRYDSFTEEYTYCESCISEIRESQIDYNALKINSGVPLSAIDVKLDSFIGSKISRLRMATNGFKTNLYLKGESGVGKTWLLCAIIDDILHSQRINGKPPEILFYNVFDILFYVAEYTEESKNIFNNTVDAACQADILVLDELKAEYKQREYEWMYRVLNYRKEAGKITMATINGDIKDARLLSRLRSNNCQEIEIKSRLY